MSAVVLRFDLTRVTPPAWRRVRVPSDLRLDDLHHVIQAVMGWEDFHAHVFEIGEHDYGPRPEDADDDDEDPPAAEATRWAGEARDLTVAGALAAQPAGFTYIYDFAEDWRVAITPAASAPDDEAEADDAAAVRCLEGQYAAPAREVRDGDPFSVAWANARLAAIVRPRATLAQPAGPRASADQHLLARLSLVVLLLGSRRTRHGTREAWKHLRVEMLEALDEAGLIEHSPDRRSVTLTEAGVAEAERLLARLRGL